MTSNPNPCVLVFAGPNGSGKSTVKQAVKTAGIYINADDIRARGGLSDLAAAREAQQLREYCLHEQLDFTFETVLSTDRNLELLRRARQTGYRIVSIFVLTCDSAINVFRVRGRVLAGGHDVPEEKIRQRYEKSLKNIPELIALSNSCTILDNSLAAPAVIYRKDAEREVISATSLWSVDAITALTRRL